MLQTAPSLDVFTSATDKVSKVEGDDRGDLQRSVTIGDRIDALGNGDFAFGESGDMGLIQEESEDDEEEELEFLVNGVVVVGDVDGVALASSLRKQAELLLSNGDIDGAEDYFYRSITANPRDGQVLLQYATLLWQLRHDHDRALEYFELAALAAPDDSIVLGAYAHFLWETDGDEDEDDLMEEPLSLSEVLLRSGSNTEEYYKKMVEQNSSDPLFLKTYSQYLYQVKQDLSGAEEYYACAIKANPEDGEIISQYARLVWELHRDQTKAVSYFERAVEVTPGDYHVTAAYARFLWELGGDEDEEDHVVHT